MKPSTLILSLLALVLSAIGSYAQNPSDILLESEKRARGETLKAEMVMQIIRPEWTREMSMKTWGKGTEYALVLVTGPARDKGTANLKREKELWNWMPSIDRSIKLPPSMMSQSWMGSDFTNDDIVREFSIVYDYDHTLLKDSVIEGRDCYKIQLVPKEEAAVVWGKVYLWVDKADYLQLRGEYYDEDGYLINVLQASDIKKFGNRNVPTRIEMIPIEEEGNKTVMIYNSMIFDEPIPDNFFTIQNMKRVR